MTRVSKDIIGNPIGGGMETARSKTPANAAERAARNLERYWALAYLKRKGLADGEDSVAAILGLTPPPLRGASANLGPSADCVICNKPYTPTSSKQQACSRVCGRQVQAVTRRRRKAADADALQALTGGAL
jgi:predicted nucleic acid-binding Zn ribbon protein